uniref:ATP synthase subunit 9, mitochondrial n=1 Tax=Tetragonia tetragonoides TaxID=45318 RepID=A0A8F8KLE5_TETTT|nr:ATP synthase F0 subunit 9 [Tetragonia tetragonoides]
MLEGAKLIGAGAATIASAGAAVGIGNVFSSSIHSVARNPSLAKQLFGYAILGFALTEAIALFALMMAFLISFVFRFLTTILLKRIVNSAHSIET